MWFINQTAVVCWNTECNTSGNISKPGFKRQLLPKFSNDFVKENRCEARFAFHWRLLLNVIDNSLTLAQVIAWCSQVTAHRLDKCWPGSMTPYFMNLCLTDMLQSSAGSVFGRVKTTWTHWIPQPCRYQWIWLWKTTFVALYKQYNTGTETGDILS